MSIPGACAVRLFPAIAIASLTAAAAIAQTYPTRAPRLVVPYVAGGIADFMARVTAEGAQEPLGVAMVIDNRGGAGGNVGIEHVAKSAPDGYTLALGCLGYVSNAVLQSKITYDPIKDFVPITMIGFTPQVVVVHPSLPVKTVKEMIALAKARPGQISIASTGSGGLPHLALELFKQQANVNLLHVPFNGAAPAVSNAVGGQVQGVIADLPVLQPHIQSGRLRSLALAAPKRSPLFPDVPTMIEQGLPKVEAVNWYGIQVPAKTPPEVIAKLNDAFNKTLNDPALRQTLVGRGAEPIPSTPAEFAAFVKAEYEKWGPIAKASGAKVD
jgi:tripartite-type tricarboxylate transporter receptor subunit TctC